MLNDPVKAFNMAENFRQQDKNFSQYDNYLSNLPFNTMFAYIK